MRLHLLKMLLIFISAKIIKKVKGERGKNGKKYELLFH